ncbi:hypothetical protein ACIGC1_07255 [Peribacillus butanolivorans]|uniref:hypothetical protein n=1 Tax=Peribacillus butanolivorans TaxID=421767 RepID=UPI0037C7BED8
MNNILKPDELTGGILTSLIEQSWKAQKLSNYKYISPREMKIINESFRNFNLFHEVAKNISVPFKGGNLDRQIEHFCENGFIIEDDISAANGRFNYIYRTKGLRTVWFENGTIQLFSLNSKIDSYGFYLDLEEIDSFPSQDPDLNFQTDYKKEDIFIGLVNYISPISVIDRLSKILRSYEKDYYLEYLLNPPDTSDLSEYSLLLKRNLWESIITLAKELTIQNDEEKFNLLIFAVEFMTEAKVEPEISMLIDLFQYLQENKNEEQLQLLRGIFENMKQKEEDFEKGKEMNLNLIKELESVNSGKVEAKEYEKVISKIMERLFNPFLISPHPQVTTFDKREIIDITLYNKAIYGFWQDVKNKHHGYVIFVECKNMDNIGNPEFHQISNRLNEKKGLFGMLISRKSNDLDIERAHRIFYLQNKVVINLTDADIINMLENYYVEKDYPTTYLAKKYRELIERT